MPSAAGPTRAQLECAARDLVRDAFEVLTEDHVIPTATGYPFIRVGRDYFGPGLMPLATFVALESLLNAAYPNRFADPLRRKDAEFANRYVFGLIEGCVRRCADGERYHPDEPGVAESIAELFGVLDASEDELCVVRAMSHVSTTDGQPITIDGVLVRPEHGDQQRSFDFFMQEFRQQIPGSGGTFNREMPHVFAQPHAVIAAHGPSGPDGAFDATETLSGQLNRWTLAMRLLTGATARAHYEVRGSTTLVGAIDAHLYEFTRSFAMPMARRTLVVRREHERAVQQLLALIDSVDARREGVVSASLDVALGRFNASFTGDSVLSLVDLATAMEAVFIDRADGSEGLSGRLRARAAALLVTEQDGADKVFNDVKAFYALRSTLVHGGTLTEKRFKAQILRVSTIAERNMFGVATVQAVDRMRDLVRRAILARLCLATGDDPLWRFDPDTSMDVAFSDDAKRQQMRGRWHAMLDGIGAAESVQNLAAPENPIRVDYGPKGSA